MAGESTYRYTVREALLAVKRTINTRGLCIILLLSHATAASIPGPTGVCPEGYELKNGSCQPCLNGYYKEKNDLYAMCQQCSTQGKNQYQTPVCPCTSTRDTLYGCRNDRSDLAGLACEMQATVRAQCPSDYIGSSFATATTRQLPSPADPSLLASPTMPSQATGRQASVTPEVPYWSSTTTFVSSTDLIQIADRDNKLTLPVIVSLAVIGVIVLTSMVFIMILIWKRLASGQRCIGIGPGYEQLFSNLQLRCRLRPQCYYTNNISALDDWRLPCIKKCEPHNANGAADGVLAHQSRPLLSDNRTLSCSGIEASLQTQDDSHWRGQQLATDLGVYLSGPSDQTATATSRHDTSIDGIVMPSYSSHGHGEAQDMSHGDGRNIFPNCLPSTLGTARPVSTTTSMHADSNTTGSGLPACGQQHLAGLPPINAFQGGPAVRCGALFRCNCDRGASTEEDAPDTEPKTRISQHSFPQLAVSPDRSRESTSAAAHHLEQHSADCNDMTTTVANGVKLLTPRFACSNDSPSCSASYRPITQQSISSPILSLTDDDFNCTRP